MAEGFKETLARLMGGMKTQKIKKPSSEQISGLERQMSSAGKSQADISHKLRNIRRAMGGKVPPSAEMKES
mgnify:CR=1 FL=1